MKLDVKPLYNHLLDEEENMKIVAISVYIILGAVSFVMTVINILTGKGWLTVATALFSLLCLLNICLALWGGKTGSRVAKISFAVEIAALFSFFLVSGEPDGFSAIWIVFLPALGMFFFGRKYGSVLCAVMFFEMAFLFWTPIGRDLCYEGFTATFLMRFPVLFLACHALAFFLETLRVMTHSELKRMEGLYKTLSNHDPLTEALNRQGMYNAVEAGNVAKGSVNIGVVMFDIDFFKEVNDTYGHNVGDTVLCDFASLLRENFPGIQCRWGGEEFVLIYFDGSITHARLEEFIRSVAGHTFGNNATPFHLTVSAGVCEIRGGNIRDLDFYIQNADMALYNAKHNGRNRVEYFESDR